MSEPPPHRTYYIWRRVFSFALPHTFNKANNTFLHERKVFIYFMGDAATSKGRGNDGVRGGGGGGYYSSSYKTNGGKGICIIQYYV